MKKKNYRIQDGCWNCLLNYVKRNYDDPNEYFCLHGTKTDRPKSGEFTREEDFGYGLNTKDPNYDKKYYKRMREWDKWAEKHRVSEHGICDYWKKEIKK